MKAICFKETEKVSVDQIDDPAILDSRDAIVKTSMAGLCGSDLHVYFGREQGIDVGTVMGHEFVGHVVATGDRCDQIQIGDRVYSPFTTNCGDCYFCQNELPARCVKGSLFGWRENGVGLHGGQSELVRVPLADATLKKIPESVSDESALLLGDNFSTGFYCAEMANIRPDGTYVVIGCGTVGLLCIMSAIHMGAKNLFALDPVPARQKQAETLGAKAYFPDSRAIQAIKNETQGRGADAVMELVGLPDAQKIAFELLRPGGIMSVVGCHCTPNFSFSPIDAFDKNLTYRTGRCPARHYMDRLTPMVEDGTFQIDSFISQQFSADEGKHAYDIFANRKNGCLKAAIRFD
ncbi:MAG: alcohol dehydrogenase catalytic domain-containing protein [Planctomycetota bacterium]